MVVDGVTREQVLDWLAELPDPEIPVLTITDLGIVRGVDVDDAVVVQLAPTYSGCPATEVIEQSVVDALRAHGVADIRIERVLAPPWSTEWISAEGLRKLKDYGIAPPDPGASKRELVTGRRAIACPRCDSVDTARISEYGSTPCKASYRCNACLEPFEYFKCI